MFDNVLFVVHYTEHEMFGRAVTHIVGVFDNRLTASQMLEKVFRKACDIYCVDENLSDDTQCDTECSYYNEGKDFNIDYRRNGAVAGEVFGEIEEREKNIIYLDLDLDEDDV